MIYYFLNLSDKDVSGKNQLTLLPKFRIEESQVRSIINPCDNLKIVVVLFYVSSTKQAKYRGFEGNRFPYGHREGLADDGMGKCRILHVDRD